MNIHGPYKICVFADPTINYKRLLRAIERINQADVYGNNLEIHFEPLNDINLETPLVSVTKKFICSESDDVMTTEFNCVHLLNTGEEFVLPARFNGIKIHGAILLSAATESSISKMSKFAVHLARHKIPNVWFEYVPQGHNETIDHLQKTENLLELKRISFSLATECKESDFISYQLGFNLAKLIFDPIAKGLPYHIYKFEFNNSKPEVDSMILGLIELVNAMGNWHPRTKWKILNDVVFMNKSTYFLHAAIALNN